MPVNDEPRTEDFVLGDAFARILTETTQSLVCVLDREGRILLFNDGVRACDGVHAATRCSAGTPATSSSRPRSARRSARCSPTSGGLALASPQVGHWMTKEGGRRLIAWSNKPMPATDGAPVYLVTTGIDLTDRARRRGGRPTRCEGDPEAKLAEVGRLAPASSARCGASPRSSRRRRAPERVFMAVSEECARVLEVNASAVVRYEGDDTATIVGRHNRDGIDVFARRRTAPCGRDIDHRSGAADRCAGADRRLGRPSRARWPTTSSARLPVDRGRTDRRRRDPLGRGRDRERGPLPPDSEDAPRCVLRARVARGRQCAGPRGSQRVARPPRQGGRRAAPQLERNLHDGAQQRLVSVALKLRVARARLSRDPESAAELLEDASR